MVADFTLVPQYLMSADFIDPISHEKFPAADITNLRDASASKKSADSTRGIEGLSAILLTIDN